MTTRESVDAALAAAGFRPGERFEVAIKPTTGGMWSRTFNDPGAAAAYLGAGPEGDRYLGLNPIRQDANPPKRPRDEDVLSVRTLLIDCDPVDASPSARAAARAMGEEIRAFLVETLAVSPALIDSGRGCQLWLRHEAEEGGATNG